jgi:hypothetical protein
MRLAIALLGVVLVVGVGCGGGAELTCEYIADPENCWADVAQRLKACTPGDEVPAVFEADRRSCTYADGTKIVFDGAMPQDVEQIGEALGHLGFSIEKDGVQCARFVDTFNNRMEMTAGDDTVVSQLRGDFELVCPGGPTYSSDFDLIFDCAAEGIFGPTDGFELTPTHFSFGVHAAGVTPFEIVRCETAATAR